MLSLAPPGRGGVGSRAAPGSAWRRVCPSHMRAKSLMLLMMVMTSTTLPTVQPTTCTRQAEEGRCDLASAIPLVCRGDMGAPAESHADHAVMREHVLA
jgi:hypothetical protein